MKTERFGFGFGCEKAVGQGAARSFAACLPLGLARCCRTVVELEQVWELGHFRCPCFRSTWLS